MANSLHEGFDRALRYLGLVDDPDTDDRELQAIPDASGPDDDEHRAVLELLVATMYADATITEQELNEIDRYGDEHGWNTPTFSFVQAMGSTTALVREARESETGLDALLASAASRITTPEVRSTVAEACRLVARADGAADDAESEWLGKVSTAFGA